MSKLNVLDLFSGIGGFSLGLEHTGGFETVAFCEIEPFPRKVLAKNWPDVPCYYDVKELTADVLKSDGIGRIDVITGGFPCQDLSVAGKQNGMGEGTRSGLWSEIVRLASELRPRFIIVENVANLLSGPSEQRGGWFGTVLGDLAECGYNAEWENIPASAVGAHHRRERVWIVANSRHTGVLQRGEHEGNSQKSARLERICGDVLSRGEQAEVLADFTSQRQQGSRQPFQRVRKTPDGDWQASEPFTIGQLREWPVEPALGRVAHGVPNRMDRLKGLGNAVVPKIPELIGNSILASIREEREAA